MIRDEVTIEGNLIKAEPFNSFSEIEEWTLLLESEGLVPHLSFTGRGGYYLFDVSINGNDLRLHTYLKKITFGGRESRRFEKRAQFSAALDRTGYESENGDTDLAIIVGLYKANENADVVICTWYIQDWGTNIGRAFNCFTDLQTIAAAYKYGFSQHKTSIGQITCSFKSDLLPFYLKNRKLLHTQIIDKEDLNELLTTRSPIKNPKDSIPKFEDLFQLIIDFLLRNDGIATGNAMEYGIADELRLTDDERQQTHNPDEGYRTELGYRLAWARTYLKQAGYITSPERKIWSLTEFARLNPSINKGDIIRVNKKEDIAASLKKEQVEEITELDGVEVEVDDEIESGFIKPFNPNLVDIRTRSMSLDLMLRRLIRGTINMNTSFQRKAGLWTLTKQSRLIESILVKIPLPVFYFDGSDDDNWLIVDGLQRLSSLDNFVNKQSFKLVNLEFLSQFNGKKFSELPPHLQRRIEEFEITAYIIAPGTPKELKFNVFKRINTGGLTLTSQEIRNALNQGVAAMFVRRLAELRSFKIATDFSISEERSLDQEFITRFLAFYLSPISEYSSDLEFELNKALEKVADSDQSSLEKIAQDFGNAMDTAYQLFGKYAFRKRYSLDQGRKPINKALFEVWSVLLTRLSPDQKLLLINRKNQVNDEFMRLLNNDDDFNNSISSSTNDKTRVKKRFEVIEKLIRLNLT